jgi:ABC-type nitrate/sulfonate/bicarbonate transport system permease component
MGSQAGHRGSRTLAALLGAALSAALVLLVWSAVAHHVRATKGAPFPGPVEVLRHAAALLGGRPLLGHSLLAHAGSSLGRWAVGFLGGCVAALLIGSAVGASRVLERLLMPVVHALQLIPGLAWTPVAILLFGISQKATVFMIFITAVSPVAVNLVAGIRATSEQHLRVARMAGAGRWAVFTRVLLPSSVPHLLSGLRVGLGMSWRVVVAAEMVVGKDMGLGYAIIQSRWTLDYPSAFVCILVICLIGLLVEYVGFARLEAATVRRWGMVRT